MSEAILKKAGEMVAQRTAFHTKPGEEPYCVLTLVDEDGFPTSSVITAAKADGIRWLTFDTGLESNKAKRIAKCNRASVCFCGPDHGINLVGTIEVVTDPAVKKEMWYDGMSNHFSGPEDPNYCVLRFTTKRYNLFVDWQEVAGTL